MLRYGQLNEFDKAMVHQAKDAKIHAKTPNYMFGDEGRQVLVFERAGKVYAFNFSPFNVYDGYIRVPTRGEWIPALSTDEGRFGGWDRIAMDYKYKAVKQENGDYGFSIYLPARTAVVLEKVKVERKPRAAKEEVKETKAAKTTKAKAKKEETAEKPKRTRKTKKAE